MRISVMVAALIGLAAPAQAEVVSAGSNGFEIRHSVGMVIPAEQVFASFARIGDWWSGDHTYSGDAANLSLRLTPGGCFCERLKDGGGIEHMRVALVQPGERVVMTGALGPLLFEATTGVMDVSVERIAGGSRLILNYRAAGFAKSNAAELAPLVDKVLGEQVKRFRTYAAKQGTRR